MGQIGETIFLYTMRNVTSFHVYIIIILSILIYWMLQFVWSRRNLYKSASKLPGPFALPFVGSSFYFIGQSTDAYKIINSFFTQYPSLFKLWFGTKLFYCTSDPKILEIVLSNPHALRKEPLYNMGKLLYGNGIFSQPSVLKWRRNRKLIMPAFNQKMLNSFADIFVKQTEILLRKMEKHVGKKEVDIFELISRNALDTICETAMGIKLGVQTNYSDFPIWIDKAFEITIERIFNMYYHIDSIFFKTPLGKYFKDICHNARTFTKQVVARKRKELAEKLKNKVEHNGEAVVLKREMFLDILLKVFSDDGKGYFTDEELIDEAITFMVAGSDTTSTTNTFLLVMLGMHQDIQERALAEVLEVIGPDRNICVGDLPHLKYLDIVIKETLRLFPVAPFLARTLDADIDVGTHVLLKGASVFIAILQVHRSEKYWPNPLKFNPDRFYLENTANRSPGSFIPFSYGPRNCIGIRYAMMSMKITIAAILRKYKIFTDYKTVEDIEIRSNLIIKPSDGYKLYYELRR